MFERIINRAMIFVISGIILSYFIISTEILLNGVNESNTGKIILGIIGVSGISGMGVIAYRGIKETAEINKKLKRQERKGKK